MDDKYWKGERGREGERFWNVGTTGRYIWFAVVLLLLARKCRFVTPASPSIILK